MGMQAFPGCRQAQGAPVADEQGARKRFFEPLDLLADRALCLRQDIAGNGHAAVLGNSTKGTHQLQVEIAVHGRITKVNANHKNNTIF